MGFDDTLDHRRIVVEARRQHFGYLAGVIEMPDPHYLPDVGIPFELGNISRTHRPTLKLQRMDGGR
jgi:hypothetical protein